MNGESSTDRNGAPTASISFSELTLEDIRELLQDPATSYWLKQSHAGLLARDPVDALNDAHFLYQAMQVRFAALLV